MHECKGKMIYKFLKYCLSMKAQNTEDIFTLEKVEPPYFYFVQEENIVYKYNATLLADFIEDWAPFIENSTLTIFTDPKAKKSENVPKQSKWPKISKYQKHPRPTHDQNS